MNVERHPIPAGQKLHELRGQDMTASVIPALFGIHPYTTEGWQQNIKAGLVEENPEETPEPYIDDESGYTRLELGPKERGSITEIVGVELIRRARPDWTIHPYPHGYYYRDPVARIGATPDLLVTSSAVGLLAGLGIIQIKSVEPIIFRQKWQREDGIVEPPLWAVVQTIIEAHLVGANWAAVGALMIGYNIGIHIIPIKIRPDIIEAVYVKTAEFWRRIAAGEPAPIDLKRDGELLERLYQPTGEIIDLTGDNELPGLVDEREKNAVDIKVLEARSSDIKKQLLLKLNSASGAKLADGRLLLAKRINRKDRSKPYIRLDVKEDGI